MEDEIDWSLTTYEGNRRRQREEFQALPFREKLKRVEQMCEVAAHFQSQRDAGNRTKLPSADTSSNTDG